LITVLKLHQTNVIVVILMKTKEELFTELGEIEWQLHLQRTHPYQEWWNKGVKKMAMNPNLTRKDQIIKLLEKRNAENK